MKKIIYVGNFFFPLGNAAGKRVYANGKIFRELGYEVIFVGLEKKTHKDTPLEKTEKEYDGFKFYNFQYPQKSRTWLEYNKTYKSFVELIQNNIKIDNLDMIIYYGSPSLSLFLKKVIKYSKKNNVKIVSDCVDWLTVKTKQPIFNLVKWIDTTYQKSFLNKQTDGVITISKYLKDYYQDFGLKTVVIPPLSPIKYYQSDYKREEVKKIIYAGVPFRKGSAVTNYETLKDRIDKTLVLLNEVKRRGSKFEFSVYGFTKDEYLTAIPKHEKLIKELGDSIRFYGTKTNDEVTEEIIKSDFSLLIRDVNRDTTAGFPTKVSESISCGTPVITNKTSDLEDYIVEGENGFFIDNEITEDTIIKMITILNKSNNDIQLMKNKCFEHQIFHYKKYLATMKNFIETI